VLIGFNLLDFAHFISLISTRR